MEKLLKLPLRVAAIPLIAMLLVFQLFASIFVGLPSMLTNLPASVFILGAIAGWAVNAPSNMVWQATGLGVFSAFAPHIAG